MARRNRIVSGVLAMLGDMKVAGPALPGPAWQAAALEQAAGSGGQAGNTSGLTFALTLAIGLVLGIALGSYLGRLRATAGSLARSQAAEAQVAALTATLAAERGSSERRLADARAEQDLQAERFRAISADVLHRTSEQFLDLAEQRLTRQQEQSGADLRRRQQAVETLVTPLRESLAKVEQQLSDVERGRAAAYAELRQQVETMGRTSDSLRSETARLVTALRAPHVRGHWGEMQLRRTVELAGMVAHCDFVEQEHRDGVDGALRPDLVVHLAGGKNIVVDSKVPMSAWLDANETDNEQQRAERLAAHARHVRTHIDQLAAKAYPQRFEPSPEFVVLFVPADVFLEAALQKDPGLLEHAFGANVVLATPSTLVALLRTVGYTWRQEALTRNAQQVLTLGRELHSRLATMGVHITKLGSSLGGAVDSYNKAVSSLESRVLVTARRLGELHLTDKDLPPSPPIERVPRPLQSVELLASRSEALVALDEATLRARSGS